MAQKLKAKHQNSVWVDGDDDVWFYDIYEGKWRYLSLSEDGVEHISETATPGAWHGPYVAIHTA